VKVNKHKQQQKPYFSATPKSEATTIIRNNDKNMLFII